MNAIHFNMGTSRIKLCLTTQGKHMIKLKIHMINLFTICRILHKFSKHALPDFNFGSFFSALIKAILQWGERQQIYTYYLLGRKLKLNLVRNIRVFCTVKIIFKKVKCVWLKSQLIDDYWNFVGFAWFLHFDPLAWISTNSRWANCTAVVLLCRF